MDTKADFNFYVRLTRPLVLNLPKLNDRVLAAAWVRRLSDDEGADDAVKLNYLKLLLFVLQRQTLTFPFTEHPNGLEALEELPANQTLVDIAKEMIEKENKERLEKTQKRIKGESGDVPPYASEFSADLLEYTAVQNIESFGIHGYYAISKQPLNQWMRIDKLVLPRAVRSLGQTGDTFADFIGGSLSAPQIKTPPKEPSEGEPAPAEEPPAEEPPAEPVAEDKPEEPATETVTPRTPSKSKAKKSTLGASPPSRPLGTIPPPEDREPPTWGSNLLEVKKILDDALADASPKAAQVLWESSAPHPVSTPPQAPVEAKMPTPRKLTPKKATPKPTKTKKSTSKLAIPKPIGKKESASTAKQMGPKSSSSKTLQIEKETPGVGTSKTKLSPTKKPKKLLAKKETPKKEPTTPDSPTWFEEEFDAKALHELGLTEADLAEIDLIDLSLGTSDIGDDELADYKAPAEFDMFNDEQMDKDMEEYEKMLKELETDYADDLEEFKDLSAEKWSDEESPAPKEDELRPLVTPDYKLTSPIPTSHGAAVPLDESIHLSEAAKDIMKEGIPSPRSRSPAQRLSPPAPVQSTVHGDEEAEKLQEETLAAIEDFKSMQTPGKDRKLRELYDEMVDTAKNLVTDQPEHMADFMMTYGGTGDEELDEFEEMERQLAEEMGEDPVRVLEVAPPSTQAQTMAEAQYSTLVAAAGTEADLKMAEKAKEQEGKTKLAKKDSKTKRRGIPVRQAPGKSGKQTAAQPASPVKTDRQAPSKSGKQAVAQPPAKTSRQVKSTVKKLTVAKPVAKGKQAGKTATKLPKGTKVLSAKVATAAQAEQETGANVSRLGTVAASPEQEAMARAPTPRPPSPIPEPLTQEEIRDRLQQVYAADGRSDGLDRTPPMFSRDPAVRRAAAGLVYEEGEVPETPEDVQWQPAPEYLKTVTTLSPRKIQFHRERPLEGIFPTIDIEGDYDIEGFELPEEIEQMTPTKSSLEEIKEVVGFTQQMSAGSPGLAGVPVTAPRPSMSPRRPKNTDALLQEIKSDANVLDTDQYGLPDVMPQKYQPSEPIGSAKVPVTPRTRMISPRSGLTPPEDYRVATPETPKFEYASPEMEFGKTRPTQAIDQSGISPNREYWAFQLDDLKDQLFAVPRERQPDLFDLDPYDPLKSESPIKFVSPRYEGPTPKLERENVNIDPPEFLYTPPKDRVDTFDLPIVRKLYAESPPSFASPSFEEYASPPPMDQSFQEYLNPPVQHQSPVQEYSSPPVDQPPVEEYLTPPIDRDELVAQIKQTRVPHMQPRYHRRIGEKHWVLRNSKGFIQERPISEAEEYLPEESQELRDWMRVVPPMGALKVPFPYEDRERVLQRNIEAQRRRASRQQLMDYSPVTQRSPLGERFERRRMLDKKAVKRRIDFSQPQLPDEAQAQVEELESIIRAPVQPIIRRKKVLPPPETPSGRLRMEGIAWQDIRPLPEPKPPTPPPAQVPPKTAAVAGRRGAAARPVRKVVEPRKVVKPKRSREVLKVKETKKVMAARLAVEAKKLQEAKSKEKFKTRPRKIPKPKAPPPQPPQAEEPVEQEPRIKRPMPRLPHRPDIVSRYPAIRRTTGLSPVCEQPLLEAEHRIGHEAEVEYEMEVEKARWEQEQQRQRHILERHIPQELPPPLEPMQAVPFYTTPPHLRRREKTSPKAQLNIWPAQFRDMVDHEDVPELASPGEYEHRSPELAGVFAHRGLEADDEEMAGEWEDLDVEDIPGGWASPTSPITAKDVQKLAELQYRKLQGTPEAVEYYEEVDERSSPSDNEDDFEIMAAMAHEDEFLTGTGAIFDDAVSPGHSPYHLSPRQPSPQRSPASHVAKRVDDQYKALYSSPSPKSKKPEDFELDIQQTVVERRHEDPNAGQTKASPTFSPTRDVDLMLELGLTMDDIEMLDLTGDEIAFAELPPEDDDQVFASPPKVSPEKSPPKESPQIPFKYQYLYKTLPQAPDEANLQPYEYFKTPPKLGAKPVEWHTPPRGEMIPTKPLQPMSADIPYIGRPGTPGPGHERPMPLSPKRPAQPDIFETQFLPTDDIGGELAPAAIYLSPPTTPKSRSPDIFERSAGPGISDELSPFLQGEIEKQDYYDHNRRYKTERIRVGGQGASMRGAEYSDQSPIYDKQSPDLRLPEALEPKTMEDVLAKAEEQYNALLQITPPQKSHKTPPRMLLSPLPPERTPSPDTLKQSVAKHRYTEQRWDKDRTMLARRVRNQRAPNVRTIIERDEEVYHSPSPPPPSVRSQSPPTRQFEELQGIDEIGPSTPPQYYSPATPSPRGAYQMTPSPHHSSPFEASGHGPLLEEETEEMIYESSGGESPNIYTTSTKNVHLGEVSPPFGHGPGSPRTPPAHARAPEMSPARSPRRSPSPVTPRGYAPPHQLTSAERQQIQKQTPEAMRFEYQQPQAEMPQRRSPKMTAPQRRPRRLDFDAPPPEFSPASMAPMRTATPPRRPSASPVPLPSPRRQMSPQRAASSSPQRPAQYAGASPQQGWDSPEFGQLSEFDLAAMIDDEVPFYMEEEIEEEEQIPVGSDDSFADIAQTSYQEISMVDMTDEIPEELQGFKWMDEGY